MRRCWWRSSPPEHVSRWRTSSPVTDKVRQVFRKNDNVNWNKFCVDMQMNSSWTLLVRLFISYVKVHLIRPGTLLMRALIKHCSSFIIYLKEKILHCTTWGRLCCCQLSVRDGKKNEKVKEILKLISDFRRPRKENSQFLAGGLKGEWHAACKICKVPFPEPKKSVALYLYIILLLSFFIMQYVQVSKTHIVFQENIHVCACVFLRVWWRPGGGCFWWHLRSLQETSGYSAAGKSPLLLLPSLLLLPPPLLTKTLRLSSGEQAEGDPGGNRREWCPGESAVHFWWANICAPHHQWCVCLFVWGCDCHMCLWPLKPVWAEEGVVVSAASLFCCHAAL